MLIEAVPFPQVEKSGKTAYQSSASMCLRSRRMKKVDE